MRAALSLAALIAIASAPAWAAQPVAGPPAPREELQTELSTREIAIQANFTGIEILIYGSIDFSQTTAPDAGVYDVVIVIRSPSHPVVARRKERVAGIWINGIGKVYPSVPGFYAALSTRPFRAITSDETLKTLGIGLSNLDLGRVSEGDPDEETFRSSVIRLKEKQDLFQQHDDAVAFIGRSLFRATVALPVNVPIGRYTADIYLFRDGQVISKNQSTLEVNKAGFERQIYLLAFKQPFIYGLLAVLLAVLAGLAGWYVFRRE
ncbi:MAG: TIGR02186 family protein [Methyloceanibacter sp.]|nr:TIGR02186 family protein [Methyloceanibacter sp.]